MQRIQNSPQDNKVAKTQTESANLAEIKCLTEEQKEELINKYDSENVSTGGKGLAMQIAKWIAVAMSLFHIIAALLGRIPALQYRAIHLAFVLCLCFLCYPTQRKDKRIVKPIDWLFAGLGIISSGYIAVEYSEIVFRAGTPTQIDVIMFCILTVIMLIAVRRSVGWSLVIIPIVFVA